MWLLHDQAVGVVSDNAKILILKQITTIPKEVIICTALCLIMQRY